LIVGACYGPKSPEIVLSAPILTTKRTSRPRAVSFKVRGRRKVYASETSIRQDAKYRYHGAY
jgi:hypothetical protein